MTWRLKVPNRSRLELSGHNFLVECERYVSKDQTLFCLSQKWRYGEVKPTGSCLEQREDAYIEQLAELEGITVSNIQLFDLRNY